MCLRCVAANERLGRKARPAPRALLAKAGLERPQTNLRRHNRVKIVDSVAVTRNPNSKRHNAIRHKTPQRQAHSRRAARVPSWVGWRIAGAPPSAMLNYDANQRRRRFVLRTTLSTYFQEAIRSTRRVSEWLAATLEMWCRETGCGFDSRALRFCKSLPQAS